MQRHAAKVLGAMRGLAKPSLVTPYGRRDRAAVTARARELMADGRGWGEALAAAHREAAEELRARFNRRGA